MSKLNSCMVFRSGEGLKMWTQVIRQQMRSPRTEGGGRDGPALLRKWEGGHTGHRVYPVPSENGTTWARRAELPRHTPRLVSEVPLITWFSPWLLCTLEPFAEISKGLDQ